MMRHERRIGRLSKIVSSDKLARLRVPIFEVFYDDALAANGYGAYLGPLHSHHGEHLVSQGKSNQ